MTTSGPARQPAARRSADPRTSTRTGRAVARPPDGGTPPTAANDAQSAPPDDVQELQQEIERTREQLGETVEQLVAKADVKARAQDKAAKLADRVKGQTGQTRAQAAARVGSARDQVTSGAAAAGQRAAYVGATAKDQVVAAGGSVWQATPEPARQAVAKGAATARQHRVPLAVPAAC